MVVSVANTSRKAAAKAFLCNAFALGPTERMRVPCCGLGFVSRESPPHRARCGCVVSPSTSKVSSVRGPIGPPSPSPGTV